MTYKVGDEPVYVDERGPYILRRKFISRDGAVHCSKIYKIHL